MMRMNVFSQGQADRMQALWSRRRVSLLLDGCLPTVPDFDLDAAINTVNSRFRLCHGRWASVTLFNNGTNPLTSATITYWRGQRDGHGLLLVGLP